MMGKISTTSSQPSTNTNDRMALLATLSLSFLSTNTGIANKWQASKNDPQPDPNSPDGDVVIKYPQGAFIVVKCKEQTARYLYFNPSEKCIYSVKSTAIYRGLSLISTLLLMCGVISLANATIELQTAFAGSYMFINIFYWIGAALPPAHHWDLNRLKLTVVDLKGGAPPKGSEAPKGGDAEKGPQQTVNEVQTKQTYTEALWKVIAVTGTKNFLVSTDWVPKTKAWDEWLIEAESAAESEPMKKRMEDGKEIWQIKNWNSRHVLSTLLQSVRTTDKFRGVKKQGV